MLYDYHFHARVMLLKIKKEVNASIVKSKIKICLLGLTKVDKIKFIISRINYAFSTV